MLLTTAMTSKCKEVPVKSVHFITVNFQNAPFSKNCKKILVYNLQSLLGVNMTGASIFVSAFCTWLYIFLFRYRNVCIVEDRPMIQSTTEHAYSALLGNAHKAFTSLVVSIMAYHSMLVTGPQLLNHIVTNMTRPNVTR